MFIYIINNNTIHHIIITNSIESINYYSINYPCDEIHLSDVQLPINVGDHVLKVDDGLYKVNNSPNRVPTKPPIIEDDTTIPDYVIDLNKRGRTLK